jgi:hypothetical protein
MADLASTFEPRHARLARIATLTAERRAQYPVRESADVERALRDGVRVRLDLASVQLGWSVYALIDPDAPLRARYIGKAIDPLARLAAHLHARLSEGRKTPWIAALLAAHRLPVMVILERCADGRAADLRERLWIAAATECGHADLNVHVPPLVRLREERGNA